MKKYIKIYFCIGLTAFIILLAVLQSSVKEFTKTSAVMGTFLTVTTYGDDLTDVIIGEAKRIDKIFSLTVSDSEIIYVNENAAKSPVYVSEEFSECMGIALEYCEKSNGKFDIAIGKLIDLWAIGTDNENIPDLSDIGNLKNVSFRDIVFDGKTVFFSNPDVKLNFGAIAKGYACDKLSDIVKMSTQKSVLINFGGNIFCCSDSPYGRYWKIGVTNPFNPDEAIKIIDILKDKSIVTSGDYERYFENSGVRYHHILDPETGFPAKSGIKSVTVIGDSSAVCDVLSTAIFVSGNFSFIPETYHIIVIYDSGDIYEK